MSVARFHAFVHLLVKGAAEGLLVLHLEVQQSQRRTACLAGRGDQDDWWRAHWSQAPGRGGGGVEIQTRDSNAQSIARRKCSGKDFNDLPCSDGFMMTSLNMVRHDTHDYIWTRANWFLSHPSMSKTLSLAIPYHHIIFRAIRRISSTSSNYPISSWSLLEMVSLKKHHLQLSFFHPSIQAFPASSKWETCSVATSPTSSWRGTTLAGWWLKAVSPMNIISLEICCTSNMP